jgi:hypothetical protein
LFALGVLVFALVAPLPSIAGPLADDCVEAAGSGVAMVVDFGDVADSGPRPGGVETRCVGHTGGLTGGQALIAAGFQLRIENGLLCAINGYPSDGCGERTGQRRYLYWSYWKGDGANWQYSGSGISVRLKAGSTEGWRFVDGTGSPNDPQPRYVPDQPAICGDEPPAPAPGPVAPAPDVPDRGGTGAVAPVPPGDSTTPSSFTAEPDPAGTAPTTAPSSQATVGTSRDEDLAMTVASSAPDDESDLGGMAGFVLVGLVIVGLGSAAVVRTRRGT